MKRSGYGPFLLCLFSAMGSGILLFALRAQFTNPGVDGFLHYAALYFFSLFLWGKTTTPFDKAEAITVFLLGLPLWGIFAGCALSLTDK